MKAETFRKTQLGTILLMAAAITLGAARGHAANILFVSDNPETGDNAFHPALVGFPDDFYVVMLQNAGHNVVRFNPPTSQNTLLTAAQLAAINTNDLIVVSRSINSGAWQAPQSSNWNARVTKPLIMTSPYLVRRDGNRLYWFDGGANGNLPDTSPPTYMRAMDPADPETAFLFDDTVMSGDTMVDSFDEPFLFNTSTILNAVTPGGKSLAQSTFIRRDGGTLVTSHIIAEFPAGTAVPAAAGTSLAGYRMFFAAGSREGGGVSIPLGAGADNLTPTGEKIFMRAVDLALNNGVSPVTYQGPIGFQPPPPSTITVVENTPVTFSIGATGALPRLVEWYRDTGDSTTFTNVPGASAQVGKAQLFLQKPTLADNGALFQVIGSNSFGMVTSVVQLTVLQDTTAPTVVSTSTKWTMTNIFVTFSEPVDPGTATDLFNYELDNGGSILSLTLDASGRNLAITTAPLLPGVNYSVLINNVIDLASQPNMIAANTPASFTSYVPSRGFWITELYTGLPAGNAVSLLTSDAKYPHRPDITQYINVSSNAPTFPNIDLYGGRLIGWLIPPVSGDYTFYLRGDDGNELRFGPGDNLDGRVMIAANAGANTTTASPAQTLVAGERYFIEALWKEGTGGDYLMVQWTTPWNSTPHGIPGAYLEQYADPVGKSVTITANPQGSTVEELRSAVMSVAASVAPSGQPISYDWQKGDGAGGFTNALAANSAVLRTDLLKFPDDDGSQWRAVVLIPGASATSAVATVTVFDDVTPPTMVSAGSMDGLQIGVCFSEAMSTATIFDSFNWHIIDAAGEASVTQIVLRPGGASAIISLENPVSGAFTVEVDDVHDLAGNPIVDGPSATDTPSLLGAELFNGVAQRGSHWSCEPGRFEIVGGGADIFGTFDGGYWGSRSVTGDFDAQVRVRELTLTASTGGALIAKAGLMARTWGQSNSPTVWVLGNPPPPGRNLVEPGYRANSNGTTVVFGSNATNISMPDMWVRLTRAGTAFTTSVSSNGTDWTAFANTNATLPPTVLLGAAVTAHNNVAGLASTGRFSNFSITQPVADMSITKAASPSALFVGGNITYTMTVSNAGPDAANLVTVSDPIAAGTTHVSSTASQGTCSLAGGIVTCNLGTIASGGSVTITVVVSTSTAGAKSNTAIVASSTPDSAPANNSATALVTVYARPVAANMSYDGTAGTFSMSVQTQNGFTYYLEYKNSLGDAAWTRILPGVPGNGSPQTLTDPGPLPSARFYRVVAE